MGFSCEIVENRGADDEKILFIPQFIRKDVYAILGKGDNNASSGDVTEDALVRLYSMFATFCVLRPARPVLSRYIPNDATHAPGYFRLVNEEGDAVDDECAEILHKMVWAANRAVLPYLMETEIDLTEADTNMFDLCDSIFSDLHEMFINREKHNGKLTWSGGW